MPSITNLLRVANRNKKAAFFAGFNLFRKYSGIEYLVGNGYSLYPNFITLTLTRGCNFKCHYCSSHSVGQGLADGELTIEQWMKFVDNVAWFKPALYLCGGEPTLRRNYMALIRHIKSKGLVCAMTTNASTLNDAERCIELVESGIDFLSISLDGNEHTHNAVRGFDKAYESVVNAVKNIRAHRKDGIPHLKIVGVINPENPFSAIDVVEAAVEMGVDEVNFGHMMYYTDDTLADQAEFVEKNGIGSDYITGAHDNAVSANLDDMKAVVDRLRSEKRIYVSVTQGKNLDIEKYYNTAQYPSKWSYCLTPWFSAIVSPTGYVSPCMEFHVGNVKTEDFLTLWNSPQWRKFRKLKRDRAKIPACYRCGEGQKIIF